MATLLGSLLISLGLDSGQFRSGLSEAEKEMRAKTKSFERIGTNLRNVGLGLSAGITAPFVGLVTAAIPAAEESRQAIGQVNAALASMGPVAGRTVEQLQGLAGNLEDLSTFDDDDILKSVTANLLTFGNVTGSVFDRAQIAAVNLSARLGQDLQSSAIQLGKALNDPVKGLTALARVGVSFTAQQQEQIKAMTKAGDVAGAQSIILGELEKQFGGAAKAMRDASPGAAVQQEWRAFQETIGEVGLKFLPIVTGALQRVLATFNNLSPATQQVVVAVAAIGAAVGPVLVVLGGLTSAIAPLLAGLGAAGGALGALSAGVLLPLAAAAGAVYLVWKNWDTIAPILMSIGRGIVAVFGPPIREIVNALGAALTALWTGPLGSLLTAAAALIVGKMGEAWRLFGPAIVALVKTLGTVVATVLMQIADAINVVGALLQGDWAAAWTYAKKLVTDGVAGALRSIEMLAPGAIAAMKQMYDGVKTWLQDKLGAVFTWVSDRVRAVGDVFYTLYDRVVGHSYIPDMVDQIGQHIARLDGNMVAPIRAATAEAAARFADLQKAANDNVAGIGATSIDPASLPVLPDLGGQTERAADGVKKANAEIAQSFATMAKQATGSLEGLVGSIKSGNWIDAIKGAADVVGQIAQAIGGNSGGGGIGSIAQTIGSIFGGSGGFGGGFARGGPVVGNKTYLVGENGPELFRPSSGGSIVANDRIGSAGGGSVTFDLRGAVMTEDLLRQMEQMASRAERNGANRGMAQTVDFYRRQNGRAA